MMRAFSIVAATLCVVGLPAANPAFADGLKDGALGDARACANFAGNYLGIAAGIGEFTAKASSGIPKAFDETDSRRMLGFAGGYNWQRGCRVIGWETDAAFSGTNQHHDTTIVSGGRSVNLDYGTRLRTLSTYRGRIGETSDNSMIYLTGGLAMGDIQHDLTSTVVGSGVSTRYGDRGIRFGWTAGVGAEVRLNSLWSLKAEALYIDFFDRNRTFYSPADPTKTKFQDGFWQARLGLNYAIDHARNGPLQNAVSYVPAK